MLFPNSFVGFFNILSGVLIDLGEEWVEAKKSVWGETFISSGLKCAEIAENLASIRDQFDKEQSASQ